MSANEQRMKGDISDFASEMKKMVNNRELSDIKFRIGPNRKEIVAHKCILSGRCEVFRAMFSDHTHKHKDGEVPFVLSDITPEIFLPMLEFIYTNCVTLNGKIAIDVLASSIEYGLDGLRQLTIEYLVNNLSVSNACDAMQAAVTYGQDDLREKALEYIEQNTPKVFQSKSFHELSDTALSVILQSDNLTLDEIDILDAVREWATVNSVVLRKKVPQISGKVIQHVRLPLLSPQELKSVEENNKDGLVPVSCISFAWKCHALKEIDRNNPATIKRQGTKTRESHQAMSIL